MYFVDGMVIWKMCSRLVVLVDGVVIDKMVCAGRNDWFTQVLIHNGYELCSCLKLDMPFNCCHSAM